MNLAVPAPPDAALHGMSAVRVRLVLQTHERAKVRTFALFKYRTTLAHSENRNTVTKMMI